MKKYYIYLNGERYMEMPGAYNIKKDVHMWSNDFYDKILGKSNAVVLKDDNILIHTKRIFPERYGGYGKYNIPIPPEAQKYIQDKRDRTIKHELRHIEQHTQKEWLGNYDIIQLKSMMEEFTPSQRYAFFHKRKGYWENPYEVEAREWGEKNIILKRALEQTRESIKQNLIKPI